MLRTPLIWDNKIIVEGDDTDAYLRELPDGATFHDGVLELLGALIRGGARTVIDVGANLGIHALGLAALTPAVRVTAVEANPRTTSWLQHNANRNGCTNVTVVQRAISDEPGSLTFCDNHEFAAGSMPLTGAAEEFVDVLRARDDATHEIIEVPAVRLDDLVDELDLRDVDVLKIDVEGHDIRVLRGARRTLERHRPVVIMEFATLAISLHAGLLPSDVLREVRSLFERVYVVQEGGYLREIADKGDVIAFLESNATRFPVQDLVCVPAGSRFGSAVAARVTDVPTRAGVDRLADELAAARATVADNGRRIAQLQAELDLARNHAHALERTLSWRITRPLRVVREKVK